jgi:hypothetical protein
MAGLAKKLQACGVNVTERELSNPETLKRLRKSVNECQALFARFGVEDEEDEDEADEEDVAVGARLTTEWENAGYPPFYYDGGEHLQFNYESARNIYFVGDITDMAEVIGSIRFLKNRTMYNSVGMYVSGGADSPVAEISFVERADLIPSSPIPSLRYIRDKTLLGIYPLNKFQPEKPAIPANSEVDLDLVDKLNWYWEKARRPAVLYNGSDDIEFNPAVWKIPKMVATTSSFKDVLLAMRKLRRIGYKGVFVTVDADFKNNHRVFFHGIRTPVDTFRHYLRDYGTLDITLVRY